jgi:hypothetical protein
MRRIREKYEELKLFEFNKEKLAVARIVRYIRRKLLFTPQNYTLGEIKRILPIHRFRCYVYDSPELDNLNDTFDANIAVAQTIEDDLEKVMTISHLEDERERQYEELIKIATKIPVLLNLNIYGNDPTISVYVNKKEYKLDKKTQNRILAQYEYVKKYTPRYRLLKMFVKE